MAHITISESLQASWNHYDRDARKRVGQCSRGALALIGKFSVALQNAVEDIEASQLFSALVESVQNEVASKGYHKGHISFWSNALRNVLRRSGYYSRIGSSKKPNNKVELRHILSIFGRRHETVTYMAPMEYVWLEQATLRFQTFTIQKFSKEQLLWHITVIEALFGEDIPGVTKRLAKRTAAVIGQSETERNQIKKRFEELYDFRSRLVHGDKFKKQIWGGHLRDARDMSRQFLLWFINLANKFLPPTEKNNLSALPTRNELLALIDLRPDAITRFAKIIRSEPSTFPAISSWSGPTTRHEKQK